MSSNQAPQKVRWLLNAEKAGHTGSLDPLATGRCRCASARRPVLPVSSRCRQGLRDGDAQGITTTTGDAEGELLAERDVTVGRDDLEQALPRFRGDIE